MEACLNVRANSFLKYNSLPTRFWLETAGRIRGQEGKHSNLLGANYRAARRLKRKRKIGFHLRKFPILNKCSQNKERLGIFKDNNNAKSRSIALCFSRWLSAYLPWTSQT